MKAVTWHGKRDVRVDNVPDPEIVEGTDAIIRVTSSGLCGSDLHLYELFGAFMDEGDILGHEPMGIVEEVGKGVGNLNVGDRVVVPFNISCGHCFMCDLQLFAQCETTQNTEHGTGASLFGYTKLYGQVAGGQAEYLRVPHADFGPIKVPEGPSDDRFVYLSDVLPTAWQAVEFAEIPEGGSVAVFGLGPIGQMACRVAALRGHRVIGIDRLVERLAKAHDFGVEVLNMNEYDSIPDAIRDKTDGRGTDSVIDAVGMEAHGTPLAQVAQQATTLLPDKIAAPMMQNLGIDKRGALLGAFDAVRRGGTVSISGVYAGQVDPIPMFDLFDKGVTLRMGQANVRRWTDDILPLLEDESDPLGTEDFATHHLPLDQAPDAYEMFQKKRENAIKILFQPGQ